MVNQRTRSRLKPLLFVASLALLVLAGFALTSAGALTSPDDWLQWGGPNRNFMTSSTGLAASWPASGPRQLWSRALGEGYSGIVVEGNRLYTMYRLPARFWQIGRVDQEVVVALDASTGNTIWEHTYDAPLLEGTSDEYGPGPHSTPLIAGNRLFTVGATGKFLAIDKTTGRVLWSHDLHNEYGVTWYRGYSCSPIAYKDTVILTTGEPGRSVMAFRQDSGAVVWQAQDFEAAPSSPILITVEGEAASAPVGKAGKGKARGRTAEPERQEQLVVFMSREIAGLNPSTGELLWRHPHRTQYGLNISTPVWIEGNRLFCSAAYDSGSRMLRLKLADGKTTVEEMWFNNRMRIHIGDAIYNDGFVLGSNGDFGPAFLTAVDAETGKELWRERGFARANLVAADGKLLILDEKGVLGLATASREGMKVLGRASIFDGRAWTPPTLSGTRLFARDRQTIVGYDLR